MESFPMFLSLSPFPLSLFLFLALSLSLSRVGRQLALGQEHLTEQFSSQSRLGTTLVQLKPSSWPWASCFNPVH